MMTRVIAGVLAFSLLGSALAFQAGKPMRSDDSIDVTIVGLLRSGLVAIGGETTGSTITAKGITWELNLPKGELANLAEKLNGKRVRVQGSLDRRTGVEINERWIVSVTRLSPL